MTVREQGPGLKNKAEMPEQNPLEPVLRAEEWGVHVSTNAWTSWVTVHPETGPARTLTSPEEALDYLENAWPRDGGLRRQNAIAACRGVLRKSTPAAVARETFCAACREAGLLCQVTIARPAVRLPASVPLL